MKRYLKGFAIALVAMLFMNKVKAYTINGEVTTYAGSGVDKFTDVLKSSDGGYVVVGNTHTTKINADKVSVDALIVKYGSDGQIEWEQIYGDNDSDSFSSVIETNDGGYVTVGYVQKHKNCVSYSPCNMDYKTAVIVKYSQSGEKLWETEYKGNRDDEYFDVVETDDGFIVVGITYSEKVDNENVTIKGYYDTLIVKYDKNGKELSKTIYGGDGVDALNKIVKIDNGYVAVGGFTSNTIELSGHESITKAANTTTNGLIVKLDKAGKILSHKSYSETKTDKFSGITYTKDGGFVIVGNSADETMDSNTLIIKYDKDGNKLWKKSFGTAGFMKNETFVDVIETSDGGYLATGYITSTVGQLKLDGASDGIAIKYDKDGNIEWQKNFDGGGHGYDELTSIIETGRNEYVAVGYTEPAKAEKATRGYYDGLILTISFEYEITKEDAVNGTFDAIVGDDNRGYVTPHPEAGFQVKDVVVKDSKGNNVPVKKDNGYYFDLYDDVTVSVTFEKQENKPTDSTVIQIKENPNTGDYITKYIVFFGISFTGIIVSLFLKHKFIK